jgi:hypothetical protein
MPISDYLSEVDPNVQNTYSSLEEPDKQNKKKKVIDTPNNPQINIPSPGQYEQQLATLINQQPERENYIPSVKRRILNALAGYAIGGRGHRLEAIEGLNSLGYDRAESDWQSKIKALDPLVKSEQERTKTGLETAKLGEKTELDSERESRLAEAGKELAAHRSAEEVITKQRDDLRNQLAAGNLSLKEYESKVKEHEFELTELRKKNEDLQKQIEGGLNRTAAQKRAETVAGTRQNAYNQDFKPATKQAGDQIINSIKEQNLEGDSLKDAVDAAPDEETKKYITAKLPSINKQYPAGPKATTAEQNTASSAVLSMHIINNIRSLIPKNLTGPIKGRVEKGQLIIGNASYDMQALKTALTNLSAAEAAAISQGRTTKVMFDAIQSGSGKFEMNADQMRGALDSIYDIAKHRARGRKVDNESSSSSLLDGAIIKEVK